MTALIVISISKPQPQFVQRRYAYQQYTFDGRYFYVREEHNSKNLVRRDRNRIQILPQCLEDIRSIQLDPTATVFAVEQDHDEPIEALLHRGYRLPLDTSKEYWCQLNTARYRAVDFR